MARKQQNTNNGATLGFEQTLWSAADKLPGREPKEPPTQHGLLKKLLQDVELRLRDELGVFTFSTSLQTLRDAHNSSYE